jgi:hypothetical protein
MAAGMMAAPGTGRADPNYTPPWPEFADIEHGGQCPGIVSGATDPQTLATWDQEHLDELYGCLKAGVIPDGMMNGTVIFAPGGGFDHFSAYAQGLGFPVDKNGIIAFAQALWQGKFFYPKDHALLNKMGPDVKPLLGHDLAGQMRFPAKVYCGQSLLDSRRESIVIDYMFSDTVKVNGQSPYDDNIDWIAAGKTQSGKRGLMVRDEIRMIKPGFYLGRAYMDRLFILNFTLATDAPANGTDVCWPGYQSAGN